MKKLLWLLPLLASSLPVAAQAVTQNKTNNYSITGVTLSPSGATGSVYRAGEAIRFTATTDASAYILVFDIDTDGFVHLLYPRENKSLRQFSAGESLTIPSQTDESLVVTGKTGMEFVFAVAVPDRDAISEREIDWFRYDETQPADRRWRVDGDPFLAANQVAGRLVRGISYARNVGLAFTYFFVNEAVDYPRYLCEDCYKNDTDPYNPDRPWVATGALDREDGLRYPLAEAFELASDTPRSTDTEIGVSAPATTPDGVTNVYVSYYPAWSSGYYSGWGFGAGYGWPYYSWGCYPYNYPSYGCGWYFSVGFNWGWRHTGWGWRYPYYGYCGRAWPYYGYGDYYLPYHHYRGRYYSVAQRTVRPGPSTRYRYKNDVGSSSWPVAYRSKGGNAPYDARSYRGKPSTRYTPRSTYKGYSSYGSYKGNLRSVYRPRQTTYGKTGYKRGYGETRSTYRPRGGYTYPQGKSYRTRSFTNSYPRSTRSYSTNNGQTRTRGYGSFGRSFTKSRSTPQSSGGHSRTRSYSGGGGKSRTKTR